MKKFYTVIFLLLCFLQAFSQRSFTLDWEEFKIFETAYGSEKVPAFQDEYFTYNGEQVQFLTRWEEPGLVDENSLSVSNVVYQPISQEQLYHLKLDYIPSDLQASITSSSARGIGYTFLQLSPIVKTSNGYQKVISFTVSYANANVSSRQANPVNFLPQNSILASGEFKKFYVEKSGAYRINRQFLNNLGFNTNNIDPRTIKIYGYGGSMLPYRNSDNEFYDVPELAIEVIGESDGSFDNNDFILFYAEGPDQWDNESQTHLNLYNDRIFYYISVGGELGKRMPEAIQPTIPATQNYNTYVNYKFHEQDNVNVVRIGRRWFGELFNIESTQNFQFDFENIITSEPVRVGVKPAAVSTIGTSMNVQINGQQGQSFTFPAIPSDGGIFMTEDSTLPDPSNPNSRGLRYASVNVNSGNIGVELSYNNGGNPSSVGYLDFITVEATCQLAGFGDQFNFVNQDAATVSGVGSYTINNAQNIVRVWDVTSLHDAVKYTNDGQSTFSYQTNLGEARKYVVVDQSDYFTPSIASGDVNVDVVNLKGTIFNANPGQSTGVDYIIITPAYLVNQAQELANFHEATNNLKVKVVTLEDIYTEFSTGNQDIAAIRNFIKYVYDNATSVEDRLKYVCLFGDGSFDYKDRVINNTNVVPLYYTYGSFSLILSFASDDFYAMMDDNEGTMANTDLMDIAVGRMIVNTTQEATQIVNKVKSYYNEDAYGRWRNNFIFFSDDLDQSQDAPIQVFLNNLADIIEDEKPFINVEKIYLDSYQQQATAGGERYPDAKEELLNKIELGGLVLNYLGHGGEDGLASERIFQIADAQNLTNSDKLPLFITVTCDFTRFDNPFTLTGGEYMYQNPNGGAISLIATTREIYLNNGNAYNQIIANYLYNYGEDEYPTVAEAIRLAKTDPSFATNQKRLIFSIGDPALKLAIPKPKIILTHVNDVPVGQAVDTLKALSRVKLHGQVTNQNEVLLSGYQGQVYATLYDKNIDRTTLGNDGITDNNGQLITMDFQTLGEVLFRGKATVVNGEFDFEFIVPRDALIPVDNGRLSFYAKKENQLEDQTGYNLDILVGDLNEDAPADNQGPLITLYMNDQSFVDGGITNSSPILLGFLEDENGINTSSGIGHDIVAILDGDESNPYILNDYYETELDVYSEGTVNFPFRDLEPGLHTITLRAWDTYNNSGTATIQFLVIDDDEMKLDKVLNYPNPFVSYTEFWFQHNKPYEPLDVLVQVFTVSGKLVWQHNQTVTTDGFLSRDITWDGRDDFGNKIGKGVYVYKITVKSTLSNKKASKFEKLVIL